MPHISLEVLVLPEKTNLKKEGYASVLHYIMKHTDLISVNFANFLFHKLFQSIFKEYISLDTLFPLSQWPSTALKCLNNELWV
jgi:hypothetical protein